MGGDWRRLVLIAILGWPSAACHAILGPSPVDTNWRVIDTAHYSFNVRPGSFAEQNVARLGEVLEDQYEVTARALEIRYAGRISVFLYNSAAEAEMESDRAGKAYPDTEAFSAVCVPPLDGNLFVLLSHELNHVIQQNALGAAGTYFMSEGLPSAVMSERFHTYGKTFLYGWTAGRDAQIPALSNLIDDGKWNGYDQQMTYNASASFLAYLLEVGGPQRLKQLHSLSSAAFTGRFQEIYGRSLQDAERQWRTFSASQPR